MGDVHRLTPKEVGVDYRFDSDEVLESMKGQAYAKLMIVGQLEDGSFFYRGNCNAGESLILMELVKHDICFGEE